MKRGKPLQRRTPLRGGGGPKRTAIARQGPAQRATSPAERELARLFRVAVCRTGRCQVCKRPARTEAHHVIPKGWLRTNGFSERIVWDPRNGFEVCNACHAAHTGWSRRIPRALVPRSVWRFAAEHRITWKLERDHPT